MNIWTNLLNTYEQIEPASGIIEHSDNPNEDTANQALLPLNHMTLKVNFLATLTMNGELVRFERLPKTRTAIIPCTEASMGRTSKPVPHPLCDQLHYLDNTIDTEKTGLYLQQLALWKGDNAVLNVLYHYLSHRSLTKDANALEGIAFTEKDYKLGVSFMIEEPGIPAHPIADIPAIRNQWIAFSTRHGQVTGRDMFGQDFYAHVENFPKNIVSSAGNAKLLSANDSNGFTFRGRFSNRDEALAIDSLTSQKIHNTLRWLVRTHGQVTDTQAIVIWQVEKPHMHVEYPGVNTSFSSGWFSSNNTDSNNTAQSSDPVKHAQSVTYQKFAKKLARVLRGYQSPDFMHRHSGRIVILVLDAASTGRLSVRYYQELQPDEYIESLDRWHTSIAWEIPKYISSDGIFKRDFQVSSPSFVDIIRVAYGITDQSSSRYKKLARTVKQLLIECMFGAKPVPKEIREGALNRVKRPLSYSRLSSWQTDLAIACGLWKQYYNLNSTDNPKEITMKLDEKRTDRDYLYGRLLALYDCFEERVLLVRANGAHVNRATNALRFMNNFSAHPFETYNTLNKKLNPYFIYGESTARLIPFTKKIRDTIHEVRGSFNEGDFESDKALTALFLLGYSHQRTAIREWSTHNSDHIDNEAHTQD